MKSHNVSKVSVSIRPATGKAGEGQAKTQMVARFTIDTVPAIAALQRGKMVGADGPTVGVWEFLNSDRWIIPARPGEATPARPKIAVLIERLKAADAVRSSGAIKVAGGPIAAEVIARFGQQGPGPSDETVRFWIREHKEAQGGQ